MQIDFSQMHCGRQDEVIERMAKYIDLAAEHGAAKIGDLDLVTRKVFIACYSQASNHEFYICDIDKHKGIDTPEELRDILNQWGYL